MKVLVTAASRYGATFEIAQAIGEVLDRAGIDVTVVPVEDAPAPKPFDAVVLGSAIYMGQWLKPARGYVDAHADTLRGRPLWLFSSGPLGDPPQPDPDALDLHAITEAVVPREARVFAGRIDKARLRLRDRAVVAALKAPDRDDRPWPAIEAWAHAIAADLLADRAAAL
jgi:menaquinone-dependent protoporphyrinogen oxidase